MLSKLIGERVSWEVDFSVLEQVEAGECAFCGRAGATFKYQDIIGGNFPKKDLLRAGQPFCRDCVGLLKDDRFRKKCWVLAGECFEFLDLKDDREKINDYLFGFLESPYYIALTRNKKKHNIFGEVQWNNEMRQVVFDGKVIQYDIEKYKKIWEWIDLFYNRFGQSKQAIKTGDYLTGKLDDYEYKELLRGDGFIKFYRNEIAFDFFIDMMIKKENKEVLSWETDKVDKMNRVDNREMLRRGESGQSQFGF